MWSHGKTYFTVILKLQLKSFSGQVTVNLSILLARKAEFKLYNPTGYNKGENIV
jgi:hypothetical protein